MTFALPLNIFGDPDMVEVELSRIIINETSDEQIIMLREKDGKRSFPIVIGIFEAFAIKRVVNDRRISRPLTHELLVSVVHSLGARLTRCLVSDLKDNTYYAILTLERDGKKYEVDARPSDAIALALYEKAAIFVEESVMDAVAKEEE
jgi:bifunctional DNase/RNase